MALRIGVIADDFTGATDIAGFLVSAGFRTIQLTSPESPSKGLAAEALVISLKTRSCPADEAVAQSLHALQIIRRLGAERVFFKYCSTFDSTPRGNIGPVTDALLECLGEKFTVVVPALPVNGRTVYQGHLFVQGQLLHESGMKDHPVTPMTDSNLLRLMEAQSTGDATLVHYGVLERGTDAVSRALEEAREQGARYAIFDTLSHVHLDIIGEVVKDFPLVTGGSGLGFSIARALTGQTRGSATPTPERDWLFSPGPAVVLSGSNSQMTNRQVERYRQQAPHRALDVERVLDSPERYQQELMRWVTAEQSASQGANSAPLVFASASPERVRALQKAYGAVPLSEAIEAFFGGLAAQLRTAGTTRFIIAGGETSGAVTQALGVTGFEVGPQIAPGVPWMRSLTGGLDLALKSGNFGDENFFSTAQKLTTEKEVTCCRNSPPTSA